MQNKKILVAYATNAGSTAEVARAIGEELGKDDTPVEVQRVEEVTSLEPFSAVVVGAPMIMGWHRAALKFIRKHKRELSQVPVAYFFTARSLTKLDETEINGIPISVDPQLAKPPADPNHLTFRENYSTVKNYLQPALKAARAVMPVSVAFFGGILSMVNLKWFQTIFVLLVVQAKPGGSHNLPFIREWVVNIREKLLAEGSEPRK
jgi:menaquinone-dependent protoporphyrinogen IX oxidase